MSHPTSDSIARRSPRTKTLEPDAIEQPRPSVTPQTESSPASIAPGPISQGRASSFEATEEKLRIRFDQLESQFAHLKEQTRQAQKMASLGAAATMLAHEFNNLMTPVVSYSRYALDNDDHPLMVKALNMVLRQTDIITAMSDRILGLAVNEAQTCQPIKLVDAVSDAVACMCRDLSKDNIALNVDVPDGVVAKADPKQIQQVLFNLLINARQAITHRNGRINVTGERINDEFVALKIRDNGCGITPENLERIFEQFFSTKQSRPGKSGVGLGLSLCREIIEEHQGSLTAESTVGEGTTFTIKLPAA